MSYFKKYFKPVSITWWSGIAMIAYGAVNGDFEKIVMGIGAVGVRGAIK